jgi:hypothetical protein
MFSPSHYWPVMRNTAVWWSPIVAGFIGAFGVHLLTQSREREKWILDSKKQEFKELLSALSQAYVGTRSLQPGWVMYPDSTNQERHALTFSIQRDSIQLFNDRIFITRDLQLQELKESWRNAMEVYSYAQGTGSTYNHFKTLDEEYTRITGQIVAAANRSVPKTAWQRLMYWRD